MLARKYKIKQQENGKLSDWLIRINTDYLLMTPLSPLVSCVGLPPLLDFL